MDELRRSECMCRLCDRLVIGDEEKNCQVTGAFYAICQAEAGTSGKMGLEQLFNPLQAVCG